MKPAQINFVKECLPAAVSAGAAFNLNPLVILAQAAFESGWGTSNLAKECRNYFGLTAYGCSNAYWHGGKTTVKASSYPLNFRRYDTRENSFLDFARLIRNSYRSAWQVRERPFLSISRSPLTIDLTCFCFLNESLDCSMAGWECCW